MKIQGAHIKWGKFKTFIIGVGRAIVLISLVFLISGCGTIVKVAILNTQKAKAMLGPRDHDYTVSREGHVEYIGDADNRITVLYVSGTPYEMGYQHGKLLGIEVRATIDDVIAGAEKFMPAFITKNLSLAEKSVIINTILDKAWKRMEPYTPIEDLEEMRGLADGSGVNLAVIHRMHAIPDLGETSCSALIAKDSATANHHIYQLRILDYGANFKLWKRPCIIVYRPTNGNAFVNISWVGFVGVVSGMNQKGVAVSEIGYKNPPGETLAGEPMPFLLKNVLRYADTAEQGGAIIRAAPRTNSYIYFLGDSSGNAIGLVTSAQNFKSYRANENQIIYADKKQLPQFQDVIYAGHYSADQAKIIEAVHGSISVDVIQEMARKISMKSNLHTVIYDLTDHKIWVANRKENTRASDRPYVEFSLDSAWTKYSD